MIIAWEPLPTRAAAIVPDALPRLLAWAASVGAWFEPIEVRAGADGGRGVVARRDVARGERLVTVPRAAMITDVDVARDLAAVGGGAAGLELRSRHSEQALWLARARADAASPWARYLDAVPAAFPALPLFRPGAELAALAGTRALIAVSDLAVSHRDDYALLCSRCPAAHALSLADYAWGRAVAGSRSFAITAADGSARALVPVADMFNHGPEAAAWGFDDDAQRFEVWAERPLRAGEEICISYGGHDNAVLLASYGFTLADNPEDEIAIWLPTHAGRRPYRVGAIYDLRFQAAMAAALAWPDTTDADALARIAAAATDALGELTHAPVEAVGDPAWRASCARVRAGERQVAETIVAFVAELRAGGCERTPAAWAALAASIDPAAVGVARLLRTYAEVAVTAPRG